MGGCVAPEKTVIVPDRTSAFKDLYGLVVVGRTVDLETLVDFNKLLRLPRRSLLGSTTLAVFQFSYPLLRRLRRREAVTLKWKDRSFRVWVEEEQEVWIPDCLGSEDFEFGEDGSLLHSSPVCRLVIFGGEEVDGTFQSNESPVIEESLVGKGGSSHADSPMHVAGVNHNSGGMFEEDVGLPRDPPPLQSNLPVVGQSCRI
ncbi:hypothetical protein Hanom_Chr05g00396201 [Helianthus anomalus]